MSTNPKRAKARRMWADYDPKAPKNVAFQIYNRKNEGNVLELKQFPVAVIDLSDPEALHYVDPPYVHETRQTVNAGRGYRHEMTNEQHAQLGVLLNQVKGAVVLSGYDCDLYREVYAGWERIEKTGPFCDGALQRTEVLWMRNCDHGLFAP